MLQNFTAILRKKAKRNFQCLKEKKTKTKHIPKLNHSKARIIIELLLNQEVSVSPWKAYFKTNFTFTANMPKGSTSCPGGGSACSAQTSRCQTHFLPKEMQKILEINMKGKSGAGFKKTETRQRMLKIIYTDARMKSQRTVTENNLE